MVSTYIIASFLRPFFNLALMALVVIPIELALRRIWPEGRVKQILFGRNFDKRHPRAWVITWIVANAGMVGLVWTYVVFRHLL